ncbi:hypothetical protein MKEN_01340900 [Mycena kentingensis (nom. inval.)]|nr:hypothetical protein MKEN_01340900 [Mycena kentingensis (nom. inval.)]
MPGHHRHVHFNSAADSPAHYYQQHAPPPLLVSPLASSSRTSSGPYTPPDGAYTTLPYSYASPTKSHYPTSPHHHQSSSSSRRRRASSSATRTPHTLLASSHTPLLTYDLTLPPSSLSTPYPRGISGRMLAEPAVYPAVAQLTLVTPHLPWSVPVSAGAASNGRYVSVADVVDALYATLRRGASAGEYGMLGSEKLMRAVAREYTRRCERVNAGGARRRVVEEEKRGGVRRVDFLMGYTRFVGISPTVGTGGEEVWRLHTA